MGSGRIPGPLGIIPGFNNLMNVTGPLGLTQLQIKNVTEPTLRTGGFRFNIDGPTIFEGPTFGLGTFRFNPACTISAHFTGTVLVPPGDWEIGVVQNLLQDSQDEVYSEGGRLQWATGMVRLWDGEAKVLMESNEFQDIWFNTSATVKVKITGSVAKSVSIVLDWFDQPSNPEIPTIRKRCNETIAESFVRFERLLIFVAALLARRSDGVLFPLIATGDGYGFHHILEKSSGSFDASWLEFRPIFPREFERPPFLKGARGLATRPPTAKEFAREVRARAITRYLADCTISHDF